MRYMIECGLNSPIDKNCEDIFIKDGEKEIIFNFNGKNGYTNNSNIKFIVPANDFDDAWKESDKLGLPYLEKIMMVYRIKLIVSPLHFILEGAKGQKNRSCRVWKLWKRGTFLHEEQFSQQKMEELLKTEFVNYDEKAVGHFRFACFSSSAIDRFRNLRLALESLIPKREVPKIRKCESCSSDLYCRKCSSASTISRVLDDDIRDFCSKNQLFSLGEGFDIDEIIKFRHKAFHATPIERIYEHDLIRINHILEIALGYYFTAGTQFVPVEPDYGRHYRQDLSFETRFPDDEFPRDFPKDDYWRKLIHAPPEDE
jgi:hypothetical protein